MTRDDAITQLAAALKAKRQADVEQLTANATTLGGHYVDGPEPDYAAQATQRIDDYAATLSYDAILAQVSP